MDITSTGYRDILSKWKSRESSQEENKEEKKGVTRDQRSKSFTDVSPAIRNLIDSQQAPEVGRLRTQTVSETNSTWKKSQGSPPAVTHVSNSPASRLKIGNKTELLSKMNATRPKATSLSKKQTEMIVEKQRDETAIKCLASLEFLTKHLKLLIQMSTKAEESELFILTNSIKAIEAQIWKTQVVALEEFHKILANKDPKYKAASLAQEKNLEEFCLKIVEFHRNMTILCDILKEEDSEILDLNEVRLQKKELLSELSSFVNAYKLIETSLDNFRKVLHSDKKILNESHALLKGYFEKVHKLGVIYIETWGYSPEAICRKGKPVFVTPYQGKKESEEETKAIDLLIKITSELDQYKELLPNLDAECQLILKFHEQGGHYSEAEEKVSKIFMDLNTFVSKSQASLNVRLSIIAKNKPQADISIGQ